MRTRRRKYLAAALAAAFAATGGSLAFAGGEADGLASARSGAAPAGPPAMSRGYEVWRSDLVQPAVDVTTSGRLRDGTHVLTLHLEPGSYIVWAFATTGKATGSGFLRCGVVVPGGAVTFARGALGDEPGTVRGTTLTSHGMYEVPEGGMDIELKCTQELGATGSTPQIFDALIDALEIGTFVSTQGS